MAAVRLAQDLNGVFLEVRIISAQLKVSGNTASYAFADGSAHGAESSKAERKTPKPLKTQPYAYRLITLAAGNLFMLLGL